MTRVRGRYTRGVTCPRVPSVQVTRAITQCEPQGTGRIAGQSHALTRAPAVRDGGVGQVHALAPAHPRGHGARVIAGEGDVLARAPAVIIVRVPGGDTALSSLSSVTQGQICHALPSAWLRIWKTNTF